MAFFYRTANLPNLITHISDYTVLTKQQTKPVFLYSQVMCHMFYSTWDVAMATLLFLSSVLKHGSKKVQQGLTQTLITLRDVSTFKHPLFSMIQDVLLLGADHQWCVSLSWTIVTMMLNTNFCLFTRCRKSTTSVSCMMFCTTQLMHGTGKDAKVYLLCIIVWCHRILVSQKPLNW